MKKTYRLYLTAAIFMVLISGCNIYAPFVGKNSTDDYLEEALKCLKDNNINCAIANYEAMAAGDLKNQKLCVSYLSKAGLTARTLVNIIAQNSSTMLGNLANALVPYSADKLAAASSAITTCSLVTGNTGVMLRAMALFSDCGLRTAKVDQLMGSSDSDVACTTVGNRDGVINKAEMGTTGVGMCPADVTACLNDMAALNTTTLQSAGLSTIADAYNAIPANLKNTGVAINLGRTALSQVIAN